MPFCTECGKKLAEGELCNCETAQDKASKAEPAVEAPKAEPAATENAPKAKDAAADSAPKAEAVTADKAPKTGKPKKKVKVIATLIAILIVAIIVLVLVLTARPYMKPVKDFMAQVNKQNTNHTELIQSLMPDFGAKELKKVCKKMKKAEYFTEMQAESVTDYERYYQNANNKFGEWKLSFKFKSATELEDDDFDDIEDAVEDYYRNHLDSGVNHLEEILDNKDALETWSDFYDVSDKGAKNILEATIQYYKAYMDLEVTDAYEIRGKFIVKTPDETFETQTVKFITVKVNGDWFYYSYEDEERLSFEDEGADYFNFIRTFLNYGRLFNNAW